MMKKLNVLIFVMLLSGQVTGQNFAPVGAKWHFTEFWAFSWPGEESYIMIEAVSDTVISGYLCTKLVLGGYYCGGYDGNPTYVFEEDSVAYFINTVTDSAEILYDLSADPGDSWKVEYPSEWCPDGIDSILVTVDSTGHENINGFDLKVLYVTYTQLNEEMCGWAWDYQSKVVERIGDFNFLFNYYTCCVICDANYPGGLRCYEDQVIGHYETGIADSCDHRLMVGLDENKTGPDCILVYPNPAGDLLFIQDHRDLTSHLTYELYSSTGLAVLQGSFLKTSQLMLNEILPGIYFLKITGPQGEALAYRKIIKK